MVDLTGIWTFLANITLGLENGDGTHQAGLLEDDQLRQHCRDKKMSQYQDGFGAERWQDLGYKQKQETVERN